MQITAINNNLINNQKIKPSKNQAVTNPAINSELPAFADAKSLVNVNFTSGIGVMTAILTDDLPHCVDEILDSGDDINYTNINGTTPLIVAIQRNKPKFVEEILKHPNIDVNKPTNSGKPPLLVAIELHTTGIARQLIEHENIDINKKTADGFTPLMYSIAEPYANVTEDILRHPDIDVNAQDEHGTTALMHAIIRGNFGAIQKILEHPDVDLDVKSDDGYTAWDYASNYSGFTEMLENYQPGVDNRKNVLSPGRSRSRTGINAQDEYGDTLLHKAANISDANAIENLLDNPVIDVNIQNDDGQTALHILAYEDEPELVEKLINQPNINVNLKDKFGDTALFKAVQNDNTESVRKILEHPDVDLSIRDNNGMTVHAYADISEISSMLTEYIRGVDRRQNVSSVSDNPINRQGTDFNTPLHDAVGNRDVEAVKNLLRNPNIDLNKRNCFWNTPLLRAAGIDCPEVVKELISHPGVDVNAQDAEGNTPIIRAVKYSNTDNMREILKHPNVDLSIKNKLGMTVFDYYNSREMSSMLTEYERGVDKRENVIGTNRRPSNSQNYNNDILHNAVMYGETEIVDILLNNPDFDVNQKNDNGNHALHVAVTQGKTKILEKLLNDERIDVNAQNYYGNTALHLAISLGNSEMVKKILERPDVDLGITNNRNDNVFDHSYTEPIKSMLRDYIPGIDRRQNVTGTNRRSSNSTDINSKDENGNTELHRAVEDKNALRVEFLLSQPNNINANIKNNKGDTPLMTAVSRGRQGSTEVVANLIKNPNVDVNTKNKNGDTPLILASYYGCDENVENLLRRSDIDVNMKGENGFTALMWACQTNNRTVVKKLLEHPDIDLYIENDDGHTAWYYSCAEMKELLDNYQQGVDNRSKSIISSNINAQNSDGNRINTRITSGINAQDKNGNTALHRAIQDRDYNKLADLLLNPDIDVNIKNNNELTPLFEIIRIGTPNALEKLIKHPDLDVNMPDSEGDTALSLASYYHMDTIIEQLLQRTDIDVNVQGENGNTPLMWAIQTELEEPVRELLKHPEIDINTIKNNDGKTALDIARETDEDIARMLERYKPGIDNRRTIIENGRLVKNINAEDEFERTDLYYAVKSKDLDKIEELLQHPYINVNTKDIHGNTPLIEAARSLDKKVVEKLLEHPDVDVNIKNNYGKDAYFETNDEIRKIMDKYKRGVDKRKKNDISDIEDINAKDSKGITELHCTIMSRNTKRLENILKHPDIDVNAQDNNGNTALMHATMRNYPEMVEKLLEFPDIDVNVRNKRFATALIQACDNQLVAVAKKLLQHPDIDVNVQTKYGNTALICAACHGRQDLVREILKFPDVNVNLKDDTGLTAYDCAEQNGHSNIAAMIRNYRPGIDKRENNSKIIKNQAFDINKLSPEENTWSEEKISKKFLSLVLSKKYDDAEKMMEATPLIDLSANDNEILNKVCSTGNFEFVQKVLNYKNNQPRMRADYDKRRKEFLENTIQTLSYDELKENPIALNTEDGFKVLMSKEEFNPNDITGDKSLFEYACQIDSNGTIAKQILTKYDDVYTQKAKNTINKEIRQAIKTYETMGKYQIKFDNIKRNLANPETRDIAIAQIKDFINSADFKPDMTDSLGNSLLHIVSTTPDDNARGLIQKLLDKGVKLDSKNITNQNSLVSAIKAFRIAKTEEDKTKLLSNIKFLLDKGIDVNTPDNNGQTAFHHACSTTSVALLTLILTKEPNVFIKDKLGHKGGFYLNTPQMKEVYDNYVR